MSDQHVNASQAAQHSESQSGQNQSDSFQQQFLKETEQILKDSIDSSGKLNQDLATDRLTVLKDAVKEPSFAQKIEQLVQQLPQFGSNIIGGSEEVQQIIEAIFNQNGNEGSDPSVMVQLSTEATKNILQPNVAVTKAADIKKQEELDNHKKEKKPKKKAKKSLLGWVSSLFADTKEQ